MVFHILFYCYLLDILTTFTNKLFLFPHKVSDNTKVKQTLSYSKPKVEGGPEPFKNEGGPEFEGRPKI